MCKCRHQSIKVAALPVPMVANPSFCGVVDSSRVASRERSSHTISTIGGFAIQGNAPFDRCQKRLCGGRVSPRNRRYQPWSTLHLSRSQKQTDFWPLLQQSQQTTGLVLWSADLVRHANRRSTRTALAALRDNDQTPRAHGPRAPLARSFDPFLSRQAMG